MKKAKEERDSCYIFNNGKSPEVIRKGFDEKSIQINFLMCFRDCTVAVSLRAAE